VSAGGSKLEGAHESGSAERTAALGAELARELSPGDVVLLRGEMGAGKSTFIRGALRQLGVEGAIPSPTFTIGRRYEGAVRASHLDLYRLGSLDDEDPGVIDEYLGPDTIAFVEWPEPVAALVEPRVRVEVDLRHDGADRRRIDLRWRS